MVALKSGRSFTTPMRSNRVCVYECVNYIEVVFLKTTVGHIHVCRNVITTLCWEKLLYPFQI